MTRSTLRRTSAAVVAVLALGALAACGDDDGGDDDTSADSSTSASADPGAAEESSDAEASEDAEESDGADAEDSGEKIEPDEFLDVYLASVDKATTATMTMAFGGETTIQGSGEADFSTSPPSMHLVIDGGGGQKQELILVDGIMYLGLSSKQFIEYDLSDPNSPLGTDLTDQLDPTAMADVFKKGITSSSYVGKEDVDGESMEHYRVTLDSSALIDEADLPAGAPTDALGDEVTFDIWFDEDGNFRRQQASLGASAGVELNYDNWGEPVDIEKPPASQITSMPTGG